MQPAILADWVSQVVEVHGKKAEREVFRQAAICEKYGQRRAAEVWHAIAGELDKRRRARLN